VSIASGCHKLKFIMIYELGVTNIRAASGRINRDRVAMIYNSKIAYPRNVVTAIYRD